jgi:hypothetical protein
MDQSGSHAQQPPAIRAATDSKFSFAYHSDFFSFISLSARRTLHIWSNVAVWSYRDVRDLLRFQIRIAENIPLVT